MRRFERLGLMMPPHSYCDPGVRGLTDRHSDAIEALEAARERQDKALGRHKRRLDEQKEYLDVYGQRLDMHVDRLRSLESRMQQTQRELVRRELARRLPEKPRHIHVNGTVGCATSVIIHLDRGIAREGFPCESRVRLIIERLEAEDE